MSIELVRHLLGWSTLISYGLLLVWFLMFTLNHNLVYRLHSRWFKLSENNFDLIHYCGMGLLKLLVFIFFLVPYLALLIIA